MTQKKKETEFVYFEDRGTVLDAPLDVVWDFILKDNKFHPKAHHNTLRKMRWKDLNEITGQGTCEVVRGGRWTKMRFRMTTIRPFVRISEEFGGRYDAQKMVFLYTPKGKRTAVDVFVQTHKEVAEEIRQTLAQAHEEDLPMLHEFLRNRKGVRKSTCLGHVCISSALCIHSELL